MQLGDPLQQAVILELANAFPAGCACREIPSAAERRLTEAGIAVPLNRAALTGHTLQFVWQLATMGIVELAVHPPPVAHGAPAYPQATRTARYQAEHGMPHASNLFHRAVWLEPVMRRLLSLCDGDHAAEAIVDIVSREIEAGNVKGTAPDMSQMQAVATLELLAREGFFLRED